MGLVEGNVCSLTDDQEFTYNICRSILDLSLSVQSSPRKYSSEECHSQRKTWLAGNIVIAENIVIFCDIGSRILESHHSDI